VTASNICLPLARELMFHHIVGLRDRVGSRATLRRSGGYLVAIYHLSSRSIYQAKSAGWNRRF
jgi:hypothetical protein